MTTKHMKNEKFPMKNFIGINKKETKNLLLQVLELW